MSKTRAGQFVLFSALALLIGCGSGDGTKREDTGPDGTPRPEEVSDQAALESSSGDILIDTRADASPRIDLVELTPEPDARHEELSPDVSAAPEVEIQPGPGDPWKFVVLLSAALVGKEYGGNGDHLQVECLPVDGEGWPLDSPDDIEIMTDSPTAEIDGNKLWFPARGEFSVTCSSESLDIDGEAMVAVPTAAIDKQFVHAAKRLGTLHFSLSHLAKAVAAEDSSTVSNVCEQLSNLAKECKPEVLGQENLFVPCPGGWPTVQDLADAGIEALPDDALYGDKLDSLNAALEGITAALETLGADISEENEAALAQKTGEFETLVAEFSNLEPSAIAVLENEEKLKQLIGPGMDEITRQTALAVAAGCTDDRWTLQEVMMTVVIKGILATIPSYNDCLKEAAKAGTQLLIMLELFEVVEEMGASGTPFIYTIYGPGAQVVNPGLKWKIDGGGFSWDETMTIILFIPPEVAKKATDMVFEIVELFQNLYSFFDGMVGDPSGNFEDFWDWINTGKSLADTMNDKVNNLVFGDEACAQDYKLVPYDVDGEPDAQMLYFNEFPTKVNCSFIPQDSIMIPINLITGNGEAQLVLVTKEQPGVCDCE